LEVKQETSQSYKDAKEHALAWLAGEKIDLTDSPEEEPAQPSKKVKKELPAKNAMKENKFSEQVQKLIDFLEVNFFKNQDVVDNYDDNEEDRNLPASSQKKPSAAKSAPSHGSGYRAKTDPYERQGSSSPVPAWKKETFQPTPKANWAWQPEVPEASPSTFFTMII
jgi:hypothetical protein